MYKLRPFLPVNVMKNIYYSLVYSHIFYAIEIWGSAFKTDLEQKRVVRLMTFNDVIPTTPGPIRQTEPIFVKLKFLKVEDIYKYEVSKFVVKCINRTPQVQFHDWFKLSNKIHDHFTRSNFNANEGLIMNNLFVPYMFRTTNYGVKQLKVNCPRIWNKLPSYLKNATVLSKYHFYFWKLTH